MKRRPGLREEDEDNDNDDRKDNMNIERSSASPRLPSACKKHSRTKTEKVMKNDAKETRTTTEMKATTTSISDVDVDINDYCKHDKEIASTETSQNTKSKGTTHRMKQKNEEKSKEEDASSDDDDDENSNVSDISISDRPGAFAIQGRKTSNNDIIEDGTVQYSTEEIETATQRNQEEEARARKPIINDPLEAERVLETVQGTSITLDNQNDSITRTKWKQLTVILGIFVFILCAVAVVLIVFFVRSNRNSSKSLSPPPPSTPPVVAAVASPSPTDAPTFVPSMIPSAAPTSVQEQIITLLLEYFPDLPASNDQQQALDWTLTDPTSLGIIIEDEELTSANKKRLLLERFVLATIYYATNGIGWRRNNLWLSPSFVCQWQGIQCQIDTTLEQREVNHIDLSNNKLMASIPTELGLLTSITWLELFENALTGSIPTELGFMTSMTRLDLYDNPLTGSIPTELGFMTSMTYLGLYRTALSGSIPTELGFMTSMTEIYLYNNALLGSIPTELGLMTNMRYLLLDNNILTGSIPTEVGLLTRLVWLDLSSNSNLLGTIPFEFVAILPNIWNCFMGNTSLIDIPEKCQRISSQT